MFHIEELFNPDPTNKLGAKKPFVDFRRDQHEPISSVSSSSHGPVHPYLRIRMVGEPTRSPMLEVSNGKKTCSIGSERWMNDLIVDGEVAPKHCEIQYDRNLGWHLNGILRALLTLGRPWWHVPHWIPC